MYTPFFSVSDAKKVDLVDYLEMLGFIPDKIRNNDYWYGSPLREERTPSFKVNRKLNDWYDLGIGQGGTIIDFRICYHRCSVAEFLQRLQRFAAGAEARDSLFYPIPD